MGGARPSRTDARRRLSLNGVFLLRCLLSAEGSGEEKFDEEIRRISRPLPCRWKQPDPHELMHVEGLSLNSVFLLQWSLSVDGSGEDKAIIPYTFILNKYKYYATYEVCFANSLPLCRDLFLLFQCKVPRRLLLTRNWRLDTNPFDLDCRKWSNQ